MWHQNNLPHLDTDQNVWHGSVESESIGVNYYVGYGCGEREYADGAIN
jgi:hypothetical protein